MNLAWERLPELDLYMDQVITLMDKQLTPFTTDGSDKLLTPSMINNYVKGRGAAASGEEIFRRIIWRC